MEPSYEFELTMVLKNAAAGYGAPPLSKIKIEETVPADAEPFGYIEKRMNEEFQRKVGQTRLEPAGMTQD